MMDLSDIIDSIVDRHRERIFAMEQRKRSDLALAAILRTQLGWRRADYLEGSERDRQEEINEHVRKRAAEIISTVERMMRGKAEESDVPPDLERIASAAIGARRPFNELEAKASKEMERLATSLPVRDWVDEPDQRGFGALGLAIIVAEAGTDLVNYPNPAKLWTRMGLGLFQDDNGKLVRQGGLAKSASKETWIAHQYSPRRRSRIWTIGKALVNGNHQGTGEDKHDLKWRGIYLARKTYERERAEGRGLKVAPAGSIPKSRANEYMSVGHIDSRAQRYMEKALLKQLWIEWQRASGAKYELYPGRRVPPAAAA